MVWGGFSAHGTEALYIVDGKMDGVTYRQILEKNLIPSAKDFFREMEVDVPAGQRP